MDELNALSDEIAALWEYLTEEERSALLNLVRGGEPWAPFPGPQTEAMLSEADELFFGGAAGGGKTDLVVGLALTQHYKSIIYRRQGVQIQGVIQRIAELLGSRNGYNGQDKIWKYQERVIEFGAVKDAGDEQKYMGRPHSLKCFDELTHFMQLQYEFLNGWKRTANPNERCRSIATGNPPTHSDGLWVKKYWAPWLDRHHHLYGQVEPGELAYYFRDVAGDMVFLREPEPQKDEDGDEIIPRSLTFIPSKVEDNPTYMATGYKQQLQSLPEPLRSQLLKGDFEAFSLDNPYQVIPTEWIVAAQERWTAREQQKGEMTAMGVDPARGGGDNSVLSVRHDNWIDELKVVPGGLTPNGQSVVSQIVAYRTDDCPVFVDVIGVGASVVDFANENGLHTIAWNNAENAPDMINNLRFVNRRSWSYWYLREALNPQNDLGFELPPDDDLTAELTAHRFELRSNGIKVLSKEEVKKLIGRSPDRSDAVTMCMVDTPKRNAAFAAKHLHRTKTGQEISEPEDYDPYQ